MKKNIKCFYLFCILFISISNNAQAQTKFLLDVKSDGKLGIEEAVHALEISAGFDLTQTLSMNSLDASDGDPQDAIFVDAEGNVGVGTAKPSQKLEVNGTIIGSMPLVSVDFARLGENSYKHNMAVMVASVPSTNSVFLRSFITEKEEELSNNSLWSEWKDLGCPEIESYLVSISVTCSSLSNSSSYYTVIITARMSSGNVYLKQFKTYDKDPISENTKWTDWVSFESPGL